MLNYPSIDRKIDEFRITRIPHRETNIFLLSLIITLMYLLVSIIIIKFCQLICRGIHRILKSLGRSFKLGMRYLPNACFKFLFYWYVCLMLQLYLFDFYKNDDFHYSKCPISLVECICNEETKFDFIFE